MKDILKAVKLIQCPQPNLGTVYFIGNAAITPLKLRENETHYAYFHRSLGFCAPHKVFLANDLTDAFTKAKIMNKKLEG